MNIHFENAIHIVHARNLAAQLCDGVLHGRIGHHLRGQVHQCWIIECCIEVDASQMLREIARKPFDWIISGWCN